ncbi:uncharacterized protein LOC111336679 isoform X3 [Stylophora pistillata]|uniref:uncharacterized protein LOC111336679 isoform X3 n=1 Tax=Stylophora pistillata TaxID=50429 RepID=UPI000C03A22B|nr:uncharacterized protein LOC111336679 isoform X3 [Stylophora pistillata]
MTIFFGGKKGFIEKGEGRFPHLYVTSALEVEKMAVKFKLALIIFVNVGFIVSTEGRSVKEDSSDLEAHDVSVMMEKRDCSDDREVGERWERLVRLPGGKKKGICSLCECRADGKEFCEDNLLLCFKPEGCLETEMKPDHCCPQCKTRATAMTTAQPTFMIVEGTEESSLPFPFGFDANTEQD